MMDNDIMVENSLDLNNSNIQGTPQQNFVTATTCNKFFLSPITHFSRPNSFIGYDDDYQDCVSERSLNGGQVNDHDQTHRSKESYNDIDFYLDFDFDFNYDQMQGFDKLVGEKIPIYDQGNRIGRNGRINERRFGLQEIQCRSLERKLIQRLGTVLINSGDQYIQQRDDLICYLIQPIIDRIDDRNKELDNIGSRDFKVDKVVLNRAYNIVINNYMAGVDDNNMVTMYRQFFVENFGPDQGQRCYYFPPDSKNCFCQFESNARSKGNGYRCRRQEKFKCVSHGFKKKLFNNSNYKFKQQINQILSDGLIQEYIKNERMTKVDKFIDRYLKKIEDRFPKDKDLTGDEVKDLVKDAVGDYLKEKNAKVPMDDQYINRLVSIFRQKWQESQTD